MFKTVFVFRTANLQTFYRPKNSSSMFTIHPKVPEMLKYNIVYEYKCIQDSFRLPTSSTRQNTLLVRATQHNYTPRQIHSKAQKEANKISTSYTKDMYFDGFSILCASYAVSDVRVVDVLLIRENMQFIRTKKTEKEVISTTSEETLSVNDLTFE